MTELQAAVGLVQLRRLDGLLARRRFLAARHSARLSKPARLAPPTELDGDKHKSQSYVVRLKAGAPIGRDAFT